MNNAYVNDIFFNLFESVIYCVLNIKQEFQEISNENFENFLNEIKVFSNILMKTNLELRLTLKQILYLFDFVQVKEIFGKNGIPLKNNLQTYFIYYKKKMKNIYCQNLSKMKMKIKMKMRKMI